jgi:hypothetical protein
VWLGYAAARAVGLFCCMQYFGLEISCFSGVGEGKVLVVVG